MKKNYFAMFAVAALLLGISACTDITLTAPNTRTSIMPAQRRSNVSHSNFVDIGQINMNCTSGNIAYSNSSHDGSLTKAKSSKNSLIQDWMAKSTLPKACITHSEQSAVTALDFMVEKMTATPLTDAQRSELSDLCKQVIEEPTKRGFRVKLII